MAGQTQGKDPNMTATTHHNIDGCQVAVIPSDGPDGTTCWVSMEYADFEDLA